MADMCKPLWKPLWKIAFFIFIYLLLFTKGKAKSRLSFQNDFSSLSSGIIFDAEERDKAFIKARIQSDFYCCSAMSSLILATTRVELNK